MLSKARNMALKIEMLMKKRAGSSNKFDRSNLSKRLYNETRRFSLTDKGKIVQPSTPTLMRPDTTRLDKTSGKQVEMNKLNNPYYMLMIVKCFKYRESRHRSSDCRR